MVAAPSKLQRPAGDRVKTDLLTELSASSPRGCVRRRVRLARFAAREQRWGCAAGVVRAGGAAAGFAGGDRRSVRSRIGLLTATARWSCRSPAFFAELAACGRPATTQRSYGMDLLRWFRFLWALGVGWDQATRVEARDFCRWLQVAVKPTRPHWRHPDGDARGIGSVERPAPGVNAVTGKACRGDRYEAATVAHCESVVRGFYDFHLEAGTGPMVNPFPLSRHRGAGRADAHHNPMEPFAGQRSGRYRPKVVTPRAAVHPGRAVRRVVRAAGFAS